MRETTKKIFAFVLASGLVFTSLPVNAQSESQKQPEEVIAQENPVANDVDMDSNIEATITEEENKDIVISFSADNPKVKRLKVTFTPANSSLSIQVTASKASPSNQWKLDPTTTQNGYAKINPNTGVITIKGNDIQSKSQIQVHLISLIFRNDQSNPDVLENLLANYTTSEKLSYTIAQKLPELTEGIEISPVQVITANRQTAKVISESKNGIQIDENGYLRGTPTGLVYRREDSSISVNLPFSLEDGAEKKSGSVIRISVKNAPLMVEAKSPETVIEGEATNQPDIVTASRKDSVITGKEVHGLSINESGALVGTATGIVWADDETEKEITIKVTVRHPWHTGFVGKEVKVNVKKKVVTPPNPAPQQPKPQNPNPESPSVPAPQNPAPQAPAPQSPAPAPQGPSLGSPSAPQGNLPKADTKKPEVKEKKQDTKEENRKENNKTDASVRHSYISGYADGSVRPNAEVSRAEVATMIAKFMGYDVSDESKPVFHDVENAWYNKFINAVVKAGITKGYTDGSFKPNHSITRAEFVHLIIQLYQGPYNAILATFSDVEENYWAKDSIIKAFAAGLIKGYEDETFRPEQTLSRAEAVVILNRLSKQTLDKESLDKVALSKQFIDLDKSHWAYYEILEASK